MTKHERDDFETGLTPPSKAAKNDRGDAPHGLLPTGVSGTDRSGSFQRASAEEMAQRKVISGATAPKPRSSQPSTSPAKPDAGLFSPGTMKEEGLIQGTQDDVDGSVTVPFKKLVKLRKQTKDGTPIPQAELHKDRGSGQMTFTVDGVVTARSTSKLQTILNFTLPSCDNEIWGVIIGKPEKATKKPTLLIMAKDHALIEEGETRAFYMVFDDHNDMLNVIDFVFTYYKKKNGTVTEACLCNDGTHSSNDSPLEEDQSDGDQSTQEVNASFSSVDTELSLLEESQDIFHMNNLLFNSAIKKESSISAFGSPI